MKTSRTTTTIARALRRLLTLPSMLPAPAKDRPLAGLTERQLIQLESSIGRELFGPIPRGHRREFFNTSPTVWIWHEQWRDSSGKPHELTTKYEIRDGAIWKALPGLQYYRVEGEELDNLRAAVGIYYERVTREIYKRDPKTGKPLL